MNNVSKLNNNNNASDLDSTVLTEKVEKSIRKTQTPMFTDAVYFTPPICHKCKTPYRVHNIGHGDTELECEVCGYVY